MTGKRDYKVVPKETPLSDLPARRPAETTAAAGAIVLIVGRIAGIDDPDVLTAMAILIGAIPAVVSWFVDRFTGGPHGPHGV